VIEIAIPGAGRLRLDHLVTDFNGTLAVDGQLLPGVSDALGLLSGRLGVHVVTADTFGRAREALTGIDCRLVVLSPEHQAETKQAYVQGLGGERCFCIGNGRNDRLMLGVAGLSIALVQGEGAAVEAVLAAQLVATDIVTALGLLLHPSRLVATLRQ
jgi:soluble P-type ATPase